ncbi:hypothetical protein HDU92_008711 [Lobulomyces angularis]|nr:hypothetical protein HDU92_008711 [Lobulomyces angularis]
MLNGTSKNRNKDERLNLIIIPTPTTTIESADYGNSPNSSKRGSTSSQNSTSINKMQLRSMKNSVNLISTKPSDAKSKKSSASPQIRSPVYSREIKEVNMSHASSPTYSDYLKRRNGSISSQSSTQIKNFFGRKHSISSDNSKLSSTVIPYSHKTLRQHCLACMMQKDGLNKKSYLNQTTSSINKTRKKWVPPGMVPLGPPLVDSSTYDSPVRLNFSSKWRPFSRPLPEKVGYLTTKTDLFDKRKILNKKKSIIGEGPKKIIQDIYEEIHEEIVEYCTHHDHYHSSPDNFTLFNDLNSEFGSESTFQEDDRDSVSSSTNFVLRNHTFENFVSIKSATNKALDFEESNSFHNEFQLSTKPDFVESEFYNNFDVHTKADTLSSSNVGSIEEFQVPAINAICDSQNEFITVLNEVDNIEINGEVNKILLEVDIDLENKNVTEEVVFDFAVNEKESVFENVKIKCFEEQFDNNHSVQNFDGVSFTSPTEDESGYSQIQIAADISNLPTHSQCEVVISENLKAVEINHNIPLKKSIEVLNPPENHVAVDIFDNLLDNFFLLGDSKPSNDLNVEVQSLANEDSINEAFKINSKEDNLEMSSSVNSALASIKCEKIVDELHQVEENGSSINSLDFVYLPILENGTSTCSLSEKINNELLIEKSNSFNSTVAKSQIDELEDSFFSNVPIEKLLMETKTITHDLNNNATADEAINLTQVTKFLDSAGNNPMHDDLLDTPHSVAYNFMDDTALSYSRIYMAESEDASTPESCLVSRSEPEKELRVSSPGCNKVRIADCTFFVASVEEKDKITELEISDANEGSLQSRNIEVTSYTPDLNKSLCLVQKELVLTDDTDQSISSYELLQQASVSSRSGVFDTPFFEINDEEIDSKEKSPSNILEESSLDDSPHSNAVNSDQKNIEVSLLINVGTETSIESPSLFRSFVSKFVNSVDNSAIEDGDVTKSAEVDEKDEFPALTPFEPVLAGQNSLVDKNKVAECIRAEEVTVNSVAKGSSDVHKDFLKGKVEKRTSHDDITFLQECKDEENFHSDDADTVKHTEETSHFNAILSAGGLVGSAIASSLTATAASNVTMGVVGGVASGLASAGAVSALATIGTASVGLASIGLGIAYLHSGEEQASSQLSKEQCISVGAAEDMNIRGKVNCTSDITDTSGNYVPETELTPKQKFSELHDNTISQSYPHYQNGENDENTNFSVLHHKVSKKLETDLISHNYEDEMKFERVASDKSDNAIKVETGTLYQKEGKRTKIETDTFENIECKEDFPTSVLTTATSVNCFPQLLAEDVISATIVVPAATEINVEKRGQQKVLTSGSDKMQLSNGSLLLDVSAGSFPQRLCDTGEYKKLVYESQINSSMVMKKNAVGELPIVNDSNLDLETNSSDAANVNSLLEAVHNTMENSILIEPNAAVTTLYNADTIEDNNHLAINEKLHDYFRGEICDQTQQSKTFENVLSDTDSQEKKLYESNIHPSLGNDVNYDFQIERKKEGTNNKDTYNPELQIIHDFLLPVVQLAAKPLIFRQDSWNSTEGSIEYDGDGNIINAYENTKRISRTASEVSSVKSSESSINTKQKSSLLNNRHHKKSTSSLSDFSNTSAGSGANQEWNSWRKSIKKRKPSFDVTDLTSLTVAIPSKVLKLEANFKLLQKLQRLLPEMVKGNRPVPPTPFRAAKQSYIQTAQGLYRLGEEICKNWLPICKTCSDVTLKNHLLTSLLKVETLSAQMKAVVSISASDTFDFDESGTVLSCSKNLMETCQKACEDLHAAKLRINGNS